MRILSQSITAFTIFVLLLAATPFVAAEQASPKEVVTNATFQVLDQLSELPAEQRTDELVRGLVTDHIVPVFDKKRIARGALGKYWKRATVEQQKSFVKIFTELQIRTYSGAFKAFNGEQIVFSDPQYNEKGNKALVKGTLKQTNGQTVPIDFRLYRNKAGEWLIYDAIVAGLGMIKTYRSQYSERLQKVSMDELLNEMQQQSTETAISQNS